MRKHILLFLLVIILGLGISTGVYASEENKVIRVGSFECENFMMEKDGKDQGYAVDYLEEISKYTGWKYEYVYDTWTNCLKRLEEGDLDMICMANYTQERAEKFLYSKYPFGYEYSLMYALPETKIYFQDYEAMQGASVGFMQDDANASIFKEMAMEKELAYEEIYYETDVELMQALYEKKIDIAVVGNMQNRQELKIVERLESNEIFCMFHKDSQEICDAFDQAMEEIVMNEGNIQGRINAKYYSSHQMSCMPMFTKEEVEFIEQAEPVKVKMLLDTKPLGYEEDGEIKGIFWEYFKLISEASGLEFEVVKSTPSALDEETQKIASDHTIALRSKNALDSLEIEDEVYISRPLAMNSLAYVRRKEDINSSREHHTFAITKEMSYLPALIKNMCPECDIKLYNNAEECFEAVRKKDADLLIQDLYVCKYWLKKPKYEQSLTEYQGIDYENSMCIAIPKEEKMLASVINKTINYISEERIQNIAAMEFIDHSYDKNLTDILFEYINMIVLIIIIVFVFGIVCHRLFGIMAAMRINKEDYEDIQRKMKQDDITNAYNRNYFYTHARELMDSTEEDMCIVMMDISSFKVVNELLGFETGNTVLADVADELMKLSESPEFMVARFSGDDFFLCMTQKEFEKMELPKRFNISFNDMDIMLSYGVFLIEDKTMPINIMCDRASMALHNIEDNTPGSIRYYSEDERAKILQKQEIENDMEKALEERQFSLYVQPKYNVDNDRIVGGEALVRWIHPQKGMISPAAFIEIFEKNGFIIPLDYYVWEECCQFLSKLKVQKGEVDPISINVSRAHFYGKDLQNKLKELITKYHLEPKDLVLEITETVCAQDHEMIYGKLRELQKDGFKVAMDDFGSGYSSLNMLKEMPLDIIKMDLKFLDGGENEEKSHYILKTLILLAKQMNLEVVVEGVETGKQVEFLKDLQDVIAQGYFYSRPVESQTYEHMLEEE